VRRDGQQFFTARKNHQEVFDMGKVAVVYWSGTGNTEEMAKAVLEGAKKGGADAVPPGNSGC